MEGIRLRSFVVVAVLAAAGALSLSQQGRAADRKDEAFMERLAPSSISGYQMVPGPEGLRYTYRMDKGTYDTLKPFGIVARQFTNGGATFDTVLITSDSHESFHDPKVCFSAQGWTFRSQRQEMIEIPGRGTIPVTVAEMDGPRSRGIAAYFYRGPNGFVADPKQLQVQMFQEVLFGKKPMDSTFYRFMPSTEGVGFDQLKVFIQDFMVSAEEASNGYF